MHSFDYFSVLITSSSTLTFYLVTITSALPWLFGVLDVSQVYLDDTLALCGCVCDISWSPAVATLLKRLPLGGFNQFTQRLKRNVFFRNT